MPVYEIMMCHYNIVSKSVPVISKKVIKNYMFRGRLQIIKSMEVTYVKSEWKTEIVDFANE